MGSEVEIYICNTAESLDNLIPQLTQTAKLPTLEELQQIIDHEACTLIVAKVDGKLVGCITLAVYPCPTGIKAWIEDVVVDENTRGMGIGKSLTLEAIEIAKEAGAKSVNLTSRPSREAANRLYQRVGFKLRETNFYRYEI